MATCHSCFKKVPEETPHCPFCGASLAQPTAEQKRTVFGYAPSPQQLQQMQQQAQQAQQPQQPAAPQPQQPAAAPPAAAPQPQQPVVRQTASQPQADPNQDAMAATMFAPSDVAAPQQPAPAQPVQPAKPDYTPDPGALMSPASLPSTTSHPQVSRSDPAPAPAPAAAPGQPVRPDDVPPTMAVPAAPATAEPQPAAPAADDPFAVSSSPAPTAAPSDTAPQAQAPVAMTPGDVKPVGRVATVLYIIMLSVGVALPGLLAAIIANNRGMSEAAPIIPVPLLLHVVFSLILVAKAWGAIQDGQTTISPGKAVGMLFIPFFNFYWVFRAFGAYAGQYNAFIERNGINVPRLGAGLFIVQAVMCVVPYVNFTIAPLFMIVTAIKFCGAINRLAAATNP